jgi:hypothetical protein
VSAATAVYCDGSSYSNEPLAPEEHTMSDVLYLLDPAGRYPRRAVDSDQLPTALAAAHQSGLVELELRCPGGAPAHVDLTTRYVATDEFCGFHLYEAVVTLCGNEVLRTTYAVPKDAVTAVRVPHRV